MEPGRTGESGPGKPGGAPGALSRVFGVLWKSLPGGRVEPVRFRFEPGPGTLTIDPPMDGLPRESPRLPPKQVEFLESRVRIAAPFPVARVSLFFFHCRQCGDAVPADTGHWSVGLCLSCSMDNASEMAERGN